MEILKRPGRKNAHKKRSFHIVADSASFAYVESYKALRTNLNYVLQMDGHSKTVMITSSIPSEGKSNVAVNLAVTLAEDGKRVILLDCDFRKGILHRFLQIPRQIPGITSVLCGEAFLKDTILHFDELGFDVITSGTIPPNPTELLGSEKMGRLLSQLAQQYDYVLCDTPPVNALTDTSVLSKYVDGAILVVSHNQVTRENVLAAKEQLENTDTKIFGVVLNMFDPRRTGMDYTQNYAYYNYNYQYGSFTYQGNTQTASEDSEKQ